MDVETIHLALQNIGRLGKNAPQLKDAPPELAPIINDPIIWLILTSVDNWLSNYGTSRGSVLPVTRYFDWVKVLQLLVVNDDVLAEFLIPTESSIKIRDEVPVEFIQNLRMLIRQNRKLRIIE